MPSDEEQPLEPIRIGSPGPVTYLFTVKAFEKNTVAYQEGSRFCFNASQTGAGGRGGPIRSPEEFENSLQYSIKRFWYGDHKGPRPTEKNTRIEVVDNPYITAEDLWDRVVVAERKSYNTRNKATAPDEDAPRGASDELPEEEAYELHADAGKAHLQMLEYVMKKAQELTEVDQIIIKGKLGDERRHYELKRNDFLSIQSSEQGFVAEFYEEDGKTCPRG